jgi:dethiobiotin synthetase
VVLVLKNYLGSINHTLLSVELLKNRNISVGKLIFSGGMELGGYDYRKIQIRNTEGAVF